jgi:Holliday junction DNA helicase RuvA
MIGRIRGTLVERFADGVVIDVAGVGYEIQMSGRDLMAMPQIGEDVVVHTHLHVREDLMMLYGFTDRAGRDLFRILLGASGIGPKIALAMLATLGPDAIRTAVLTDDVGALTSVPGIGTRSAQKLILDLRARLALPDGGIPGTDSAIGTVREALEGLGYASGEITDALSGLDGSESAQDLLRAALQRLGRS